MAKGRYKEWLTDEALEQVEAWVLMGLTNDQIAHNIGISHVTLYQWVKDHTKFANALKRSKVVVDEQVENALFNRALGYNHNEDKYIYVPMEREELDAVIETELEVWNEQNPKATVAERNKFIEGLPTTKEILVERKTKFVPPDTTAAIFWLKNRKPDEWRDGYAKAQQRLVEKKIELLEAGVKDTSLLEALIDVVSTDK